MPNFFLLFRSMSDTILYSFGAGVFTAAFVKSYFYEYPRFVALLESVVGRS